MAYMPLEQEEYPGASPKREPPAGCKAVWMYARGKVAWEGAG